jgi:hypothetical protein
MIFGTKGGDNIKNIFQRICGKLTHHRWRKGNAYSVGIEPTEYHYQCQICRYRFWNYTPYRGAPNKPFFDEYEEREKRFSKWVSDVESIRHNR